jgi:uncharacterized protein YjeT (DUF2065 family)
VTVALGLIPIVTGIIAMSGTSDPIYAAASLTPLPVLDSNLRFFAGVWLGLGLAILWLVPRIDIKSATSSRPWKKPYRTYCASSDTNGEH